MRECFGKFFPRRNSCARPAQPRGYDSACKQRRIVVCYGRMQPATTAARAVPLAARRERLWICGWCLLAALHVFIFSAVFPFFNNVDEPAHFDLIVKYSHGEWPRRMEFLSGESLRYLAVFSSQEYFATETDFPGGRLPPPIWRLPPEQAAPALQFREAGWKNFNHESAQPPLYYLLAGGWWQLENLAGLRGGSALYGLRFLNVFFIAALVWLGSQAARLVFPGNQFVRQGVPALLAVMPQTAFYSLGNDVLSPLVFGCAGVQLWKFSQAKTPGITLGALTGLALAATGLTKLSNLPLLAVAAAALGGLLRQRRKTREWDALRPGLAALLGFAVLPLAAWMAWCQCHFGDFAGAAQKIHFLGWTRQPFAEWWHHPLFSVSGFWFFLHHNLATFWQGEFLWHHQPLARPAVDLTYVALTLIVLGCAGAAWRWRSPAFTPAQRAALGFSLACCAAALVFVALLSVPYDFHDCFYPSRARPFFVSGRLLLGALVPFLLLFTCGLEWLLKKFSDRTKFAVLAILLACMLAAEITIDAPVFATEYNWFHL